MSTNTGPSQPTVVATGVRRGPLFFGWWVVAAGFVAHVANAAFYYYGMAVFFPPLVQEFGWSRTALSGAFSIARLEAGIAGPLTGLCVDRWGTRRMMLIGLAMMSLGFFLLSRVESLFAFYVILVLFLSVGTGFSGGTVISSAVANWFVRRRSLALGVVFCGAGVGGSLVGALGWLIVTLGWRSAMVALAIITLANMPVAVVLRHRPEAYGMRPDGDPLSAIRDTGADGVVETFFQPLAAARTQAFVFLALVFGARHMATSGLLVHLPALLVDRGHSLEAAASIAGSVALMSVPGRLLGGWAGDRIDKRYVVGIGLLSLAGSLVVLSLASSYWQLGVFAVVYGIAYGGTVPLQMAIIADYFGRRRCATIFGLAQFAMMWGNIGGPVIAGYAFDVTGTYLPAIYIFTAVSLVGAVLALFIRRPRPAS